MELKELTEKTLELFETESADQLGQRLLEACKDTDKLEAFSKIEVMTSDAQMRN